MCEYKPTPQDYQLQGDIRRHVRGHPDLYRDPGTKFDKDYSVDVCWQRDNDFIQAVRRSRVERPLGILDSDRKRAVAKARATKAPSPAKLRRMAKLVEPELPTEEEWISKVKRLRKAVDDLLLGFNDDELVLPTRDTAYRVSLICWLLTDPEAHTYEPKLTEFQDWSIWTRPDDDEPKLTLRHDLMHGVKEIVVSTAKKQSWLALCRKAWEVVRPAGTVTQYRDNHVTSPPPLTEHERQVLDIIAAQPEGKGITGQDIIAEVCRQHKRVLEQGTLTRHIIPKLKAHYSVDTRRRAGYYLKTR